jgi:predicted transcriptional regulator
VTGEVNLTELTTVIVACYVSHNLIAPVELPKLIMTTHAALLAVSARICDCARSRTPAVPIEESITHDFLICLEDGHQLRSLRRYLQRKYSLSPEDYRARWNLPPDYPMVAPGYTELRSRIAKRGASQHSASSTSARSGKPTANSN